jgi:hypothetical protein
MVQKIHLVFSWEVEGGVMKHSNTPDLTYFNARHDRMEVLDIIGPNRFDLRSLQYRVYRT